MSIRIDGYLVDLAISEEHSFPGEATDYPVESGADIGDHIRALPEEITLESIVSDSPIGDAATDPSRQSLGPDAPLPSADAYQKLREIRAARRPVTVETSLGVFESMALIDLSVPKNKGTDGGLFFTATFKRLNVVTNRRTRVRVKTPMAGAGGKARPKVVVGRAWRSDDFVTWRKRLPPGIGRVIDVERVSVTIKVPAGESRNDVIDELDQDPAAGTWKAGYADYRGEDGRLLRGAELKAFFLDLERERREKRIREAKIAQQPGSPTEEQIRAAEEKGVITRNLPPGLDLSKFSPPTPPEPTFPRGTP